MFKKLMKVCALSVVSVGVLFSFQESTFAATDLSSYYDGKIQQQQRYTGKYNV